MARELRPTFTADSFGDRREHTDVVGWFRRTSTARNAYVLLGFASIGYSVGVALPLAIAHALPMPDPYLRIANADYLFWGSFFYAPVIVAAWMVASTVIYLIGSTLRAGCDFSELLRLTAFATGIGTLGTLLSDLVTSPLRAVGIINEQAWEQSIANHGGWFFFQWAWMVLYVILFVVGYPVAVRLATRQSWAGSIAIGVAGFVAFQGFEYIFIR